MILRLDNILEGGLPVGEITDISGAAGTGKTQVFMQTFL